MTYQENQEIERMETKFEALQKVITLLKNPEVQSVRLSVYHLKTTDKLVQGFLADKTYLDIVGDSICKVDKQKRQQEHLTMLKEQFVRVEKQLQGLAQERIRLENEIRDYETKLGGA